MLPRGGARPRKGGPRPGAGRPRVADPRSVQVNVALTESEADLIRSATVDGERLGATVRRLAISSTKTRLSPGGGEEK